jgi:hypothetical protein
VPGNDCGSGTLVYPLGRTWCSSLRNRISSRMATWPDSMLPAGMSASGALRQLADQNPFINIHKNDKEWVEPDSGVVSRPSVELGSLPHAFHKAIEETVRSTLQQGLYGWEVLDILVTLTHTGYASPVSVAGDPATAGVSQQPHV